MEIARDCEPVPNQVEEKAEGVCLATEARKADTELSINSRRPPALLDELKTARAAVNAVTILACWVALSALTVKISEYIRVCASRTTGGMATPSSSLATSRSKTDAITSNNTVSYKDLLKAVKLPKYMGREWPEANISVKFLLVSLNFNCKVESTVRN